MKCIHPARVTIRTGVAIRNSRVAAARPGVTLLAAAIALVYTHCAAGQALSPAPAVLEPVVVTADPLRRDIDGLATPASVLDGDALVQQRRSTLGDLLDGQPGVHADPFGGGASRAVIRGQTAPRVRVLSDGAQVLDASDVSPDHVVTVDTLQARSVEVLRGPAALLYGGNAIGGVVNVLDDKIPTEVPVNGIEGSVEVLGSSAAKSRAGAVGLTIGEGNVAIRVEGMKRRAGDYRVPHWSERKVENSWAETTTASLGLSLIGERGYFGAAYSYREDDYGLPGHSHALEDCHTHGLTLHCDSHDDDDGHDHGHDHDHDHDHGTPTALLRKHRFDMRGELRDPFSGFDALRLRAGYTDYRHDELEEGEEGTTFTNRGLDARLELAHKPLGGFTGVVGLQASRYDFESSGAEGFVPKARTHNTGLFVLENYALGDWRFELGARHEWQSVKPAASTRPSFDGNASSVSAGAVWSFAPAYAASLSLSRAQRLPNAQELYANGKHFATNTIEKGNANLRRETSHSVDLGLRKTLGDVRFNVSVFHSRVDGYIYGRTTDSTPADDGGVIRVIQYTQQNAQFTGAEADVSYRFTPVVSASVFGDYVRGQLRANGGNLPRIPTARLGVRTDLTWQQWSGFVQYTQALRQDRIAVAEQEEKTGGFGLLSLGVAYGGKIGPTGYQVYLRGTNLLNKLAYSHTSFVSRAAPLPGRSVHAGVRVTF